MFKILVINPGSTSTKFAVYHDEESVFQKTLRHQGEELAPFSTVAAQYEFRKETILKALKEENIPVDFDIIVGRGGLTRPVVSGVYEVSEDMRKVLLSAEYGEHACNLGGLIAADIAKEIGCKAVIADPVVVDELQDVARISGHPELPNISIFHALNQKAIARRFAKENGKKYEELNLIIAHLGGGVSVGAHNFGKVIDVNCALGGNGPFSPERVGTVSATGLMNLCFSGKYTKDELKKMINGKGGLTVLLGTNNFKDVDDRVAAGDERAKLVSDAFVYNVGKAIGGMAAAMSGKVDAILVTGGIAYGKLIMKQLEEQVKFIAPVKIYPGEDEMAALASNALAVLEGREAVKTY